MEEIGWFPVKMFPRKPIPKSGDSCLTIWAMAQTPDESVWGHRFFHYSPYVPMLLTMIGDLMQPDLTQFHLFFV